MHVETIWRDVQAIRAKAPLIHNITNYVVMNSTANALLAIGASPVMAHAVEEVEEMVGLTAAIGGALVINIGTLSEAWVNAMEKAMAAATVRQVPVVLDPVGAGATAYRTATCKHLIKRHRPAIIRGNASEIMALLDAKVTTKGVDSAQTSDAALETAQHVAAAYHCVVSVSGETDLITNGHNLIKVKNGHPLMTRVTGLGCTASALTGAFIAVNRDPMEAASHAMAVMGICGQIAQTKAAGPGTLQLHFYDALHNLSESDIAAHLHAGA